MNDNVDSNDELARLCGNAAKELKEARQGFEVNFRENGLEHLRNAMEYIEVLTSLLDSNLHE